MGLKKFISFLFLCMMVLSFAIFASCGNGGDLQGGDTNSPDGNSQTVTESESAESYESSQPSGNPYDGRLENGGNYSATDFGKNN